MSGSITVMYQGRKILLVDLAKQHGMRSSILRRRWYSAGRPHSISLGMLCQKMQRPAVRKSGKRYHLLPDDTWHSGGELARMFGLSESTVNSRSRRDGKTEWTREELTALANKVYGKRGSRINNDYHNPNYLPHIPFGDLAHLSAVKNTGAARVGSEEMPQLGRQRNSMGQVGFAK